MKLHLTEQDHRILAEMNVTAETERDRLVRMRGDFLANQIFAEQPPYMVARACWIYITGYRGGWLRGLAWALSQVAVCYWEWLYSEAWIWWQRARGRDVDAEVDAWFEVR